MDKRGFKPIACDQSVTNAIAAVGEGIEELAESGGGFGLFTGCAAGDTAMALVVEVGDA